MFRKSISSVLIASVAVAVVAAVAAIVLYVSRSSYDLALELEQQSMQQMTEATNRALTAYLADARTLVETLAVQKAVQEGVEGDPTRTRDRLKDYMQVNKDYWALVVFDAKGTVLAGYNASGEDLAGQSRGDRDYVKAVLSGQDLYMPKEILKAKSGNGDLLIFAVAKGIKDKSGKVLGGVAAFPRWEVFTARSIDPPRFGERGYGFMLDQKGRFLAHAMDKGLLLKDFSQEEFVKKALEMKKGSFFYDWKGERKYMTFLTDPDTGWLVCMSAYVSELTQTATMQRNVLLAIGAVAILILVAAITLVIRSLVVRPIQDIESFTARIAQGDFKTQLRTGFKFELYSLAENIRAMVAELKHKLGFAQGLLDGMTISCIVADPEGKVLFVNQPVLDFLEHDGTPADFTGQSVSRFFYGEDGRQTIVGRALQEKKPIRNVQVEIDTRKGRQVFTQVDAAPMYDLDGKLIAGFALFSDLTEIRNQQKRIEAQNEKIAQAATAANTISDQVASASEELSAQIEQSSRGSDVQRQRTGEAATAMEEMNATVMEVAKSAGNAADLADQTKAKAQEGADLVDAVVGTINQINARAEDLKADMTELGHQAEGIGQIMQVIEDIADQTNLLALNAAIEAARAGDAGRGFAVVADEVRKLAEKTMNATKEVGNYIQAVQDSARKNIQSTEATTRAITESTETANKSGAALREIVDMVEKTADQVRGIATASEEQSAASEEINRTTEEINRIASETAEAMTQSAQAVSDLNRLAQDLKTLIENMQS